MNKNKKNEQFEVYTNLSLNNFDNFGHRETWADHFPGPDLNCELFTPSPSGDEEKGQICQ